MMTPTGMGLAMPSVFFNDCLNAVSLRGVTSGAIPLELRDLMVFADEASFIAAAAPLGPLDDAERVPLDMKASEASGGLPNGGWTQTSPCRG